MRTFCAKCAEPRPAEADRCDTCGEALTRAPGDTPLGVVLDGKYFITAVLGRGGAGAVYRARQRSMGRDVAIKVLMPERIADAKAIARFTREAQAVSQLSHPNIITVHDFGASEDVHYLVMELIEGEQLSRVVGPARPLPFARAVTITCQICDALTEAHDKGIVHRDLKSQNVMLTQRSGNPDFVKVLDFGLVKIFNAEHAAAITEAGRIVGTPAYMSPEQIEGLPVDPRSDLYSAGVILFELLAGRPPYISDDLAATLTRQVTEPLPPLSDVNPESMLPAAVDTFLARVMAKDPSGRPSTAAALKRELLELAELVEAAELETQVSLLPYELPLIDPEEAEAQTVPDQDPTRGRSQAALEREHALVPVTPEDSEVTTAPARTPLTAALNAEETVRDLPAAGELTPLEVKARQRKWPRAADRRPRPALPLGDDTERDVRSHFEQPAPREESATLRLRLGEEPTAPARKEPSARVPVARARLPLPVVFVLAVMVALGGALWLLARGDDTDTSTPDVDAEAAGPTRPNHTVLVTRSEPGGAALLVDGEWRCETPCRVELPRTSKPRTLSFKLDGFQQATREVLLGSDVVRVPLVTLVPLNRD